VTQPERERLTRLRRTMEPVRTRSARRARLKGHGAHLCVLTFGRWPSLSAKTGQSTAPRASAPTVCLSEVDTSEVDTSMSARRRRHRGLGDRGLPIRVGPAPKEGRPRLHNEPRGGREASRTHGALAARLGPMPRARPDRPACLTTRRPRRRRWRNRRAGRSVRRDGRLAHRERLDVQGQHDVRPEQRHRGSPTPRSSTTGGRSAATSTSSTTRASGTAPTRRPTPARVPTSFTSTTAPSRTLRGGASAPLRAACSCAQRGRFPSDPHPRRREGRNYITTGAVPREPRP
jgi:hypothetical protein